MSEFVFRVTDVNPVHVRVSVYAGPAGRTLGLCGHLVFRADEWEEFTDVWLSVRDNRVRVESLPLPDEQASLYSELAEPAPRGFVGKDIVL